MRCFRPHQSRLPLQRWPTPLPPPLAGALWRGRLPHSKPRIRGGQPPETWPRRRSRRTLAGWSWAGPRRSTRVARATRGAAHHLLGGTAVLPWHQVYRLSLPLPSSQWWPWSGRPRRTRAPAHPVGTDPRRSPGGPMGGRGELRDLALNSQQLPADCLIRPHSAAAWPACSCQSPGDRLQRLHRHLVPDWSWNYQQSPTEQFLNSSPRRTAVLSTVW